MIRALYLFLLCMTPVLFANVAAIITDIEGTTTSISFVHDELFPYAKSHLQQFVLEHQADPAIRAILNDVEPGAPVGDVIATLLAWIDQDKKATPLKTLQGIMWEDGYRQGAFKGHVYADAYQKLVAWKGQGIPLYVYSSGSVQAQKLLYGYSVYGDMTPLFSGYFDTRIGSKKESGSYTAIANAIGMPSSQLLFLSDSIDEIQAAQQAGMQTVWVCRDSTTPVASAVASFDAIQLP